VADENVSICPTGFWMTQKKTFTVSFHVVVVVDKSVILIICDRYVVLVFIGRHVKHSDCSLAILLNKYNLKCYMGA
jgi:hypothetical protein